MSTEPAAGQLSEADGILTAAVSEAGSTTFLWSVDLTSGLVWRHKGTSKEKLQAAPATVSLCGSNPPRYVAVVNGLLTLSTAPFTWTLIVESEG